MLVSGQAGPLQGPVALGQAIAAASRDPPGPRRQPAPCTASPAAAAPRDRRHNTEGGLDRVDPSADEQAASDGRAPAVFARAAAIASQADEAVEVVDAALDHSSHRDRAGGRRITVSTSAKNLVQELQKTVDELAGTPGRPSRSNGGQHHAVVTPRVEASPDRSDFAKLGETIALEQTKQFADDIRSQVAEKSRELAEMNERPMAFGDPAAPGRRPAKTPLHGLPCPPQRLMIADLAPIDHDPHRLAVTVYHHEVEGRREGVILEGLRQRVRVVSLVEPHRQHAAIWADGTKDAGLLHSDIDAVAQRLLKIFFHLWVSIGFRERVGSDVLYLLTMALSW